MASTIRAWRAAAPLLEEAAVGHFVGQGMLERVLKVGEQPRLVEELGRLEMSEAVAQLSSGSSAMACSNANGTSLPIDRGGLQQPLVLGREPVDARGQDRLDRRRDLETVRRRASRYAPRSPVSALVSTSVRTLSSRKNGLPSVRSISSCFSGCRRGRPRAVSPAAPRRSRAEGGRCGAGGSRSCCPSRAGTPAGS